MADYEKREPGHDDFEITEQPPPTEEVEPKGDDAPTEEELHTLRRVPDKIPWKIYTIAYVEMVERLSYYGCVNIFVNFIQQPRPTPTGAALHPNSDQAQPGALGLGQQASTGLTTFNSFWNYFTPLGGAFIADTYLGRFKTIFFGIVVAIIGHVILVISAIPTVLDNPSSAVGAFAVGIVIMGLGTGAFKPNISPLIAEQVKFHKLRVETTPKGERVIVDNACTIARIYNWFYLFINVGALIGQIAMAYAERYVGFWVAFLIPTCIHCTSLIVMYFCKSTYNLRPPEGSVLGPAVKLLLRGTKGRWHINPFATWKHMHDGTFWDSLKPSRYNPQDRPAWMTFDDAWVDEVRRGWAACNVFLWLPLYWLSYNQLNNNLTSQAATMNLGGVPNDVIANLDPFALIIFIPLCDLFFYPALRKWGVRFTPIKKISAGFLLGCFAMIWAAVIQLYIYKTSPCGYHASDPDCAPSPITVWAQTGSYVLIAFSEIFASITSLEYGFSKAPKNMRSLVAAFALFMSAVASALGEAFLPLLIDPHITWNYGSVGIIAGCSSVLIFFFYRGLDKSEDDLNQLDTGHMNVSAGIQDMERNLSVSAPDHETEKIAREVDVGDGKGTITQG